MTINAVVDRIENGFAILLPREIDIEISIPVDEDTNYIKGDVISLEIDNDGTVKNAG
ncbi:MAG: hypothetical protein GX660_24430 [Clostridiaceae bacterium]|nr:hypothetical protein [Clostridiaceae bacterium]